jgi:single-strand DNA-binding protein
MEQRTWETDEGDRRSKVEIVADEIGPSLLFATAEVQRTERRSPAVTEGDNGLATEDATGSPVEEAGVRG